MWMDIAQQNGHSGPAEDSRNSDDEDTVFDRTNPFYEAPRDGGDDSPSKSSFEPGGYVEGGNSSGGLRHQRFDEQETRCGLYSWRPHCLRKCANRTAFSIIFTIVGLLHSSVWSYYTSNISTLEKRFAMSSTTTGVLLFANELAQVLAGLLFTYFNLRHRLKMLSLGVALSSISCFLLASPHFFMGSGEMPMRLVKQSFEEVQHPQSFVAIIDGQKFQLEHENIVSTPETASLIQNQPLVTKDSDTTSLPPLSPLQGNRITFTTRSDNNTFMTTGNTSGLNATDDTVFKSTTMPVTLIQSTSTSRATIEPVEISLVNDGMSSPWPTCRRSIEPVPLTTNQTAYCDNTMDFERKLAFGFIFSANFLFGIASMLYLLSGGPFSEESTIFPNEIPRIFGITMSIRIIGSFFGYLFAWSCLSEFINPLENPVQIDSRWLGAYWLGWLALSFVLALFTFVFSMFPRKCPDEFLKKRSLTHDTGIAMLLIPSTASFFGGAELKTANGFPSLLNVPGVFQAFFRNRIFLLLTMAQMAQIFVAVGYATFLPKYLEFIFRLRSNNAALLTGLSSVPCQVAGLMLSGAFISRYLPSSKEISHWNCTVTALHIVSLLIMSFLGCETNMASFVPHGHSINKDSTLSSSSSEQCSSDCGCDAGPPVAVCDRYTGTTYYSPCHAGCEEVSNQTGVFTHCSCLPFANSTLVEGYCPGDDCGNGLIAFLVFICLGQFLKGSTIVGRMLLSYKSLQADQRTAIIGFTLLILSIVSVIPSPIVFGSLFEAACLVREEPGSCRADKSSMGNCWLYNDASLRLIYNLGAAAFLVIGFALDAVIWKNRDVQELRIYDGELRQLTTGSQDNNNRFSNVPL